MSKNDGYPKIGIRSKNELAKRISGKRSSFDKALELINDVIQNHDRYWYDVLSCSKIEENKIVRSAKGTPLGRLLLLIDRKVLVPHDRLVPDFIFGGISGKDHVQAANYTLGRLKKRTWLHLDIRRFFEQNSHERVFHLFHKKCLCGVKGARLLADLCCVPEGLKNKTYKPKVLARGFATSPRLAYWCNADLFLRINRLVKKYFKNRDARLAIYVDDIGISASRTTKEEMEGLSAQIENLLLNFDPNQSLALNNNKYTEEEKIVSYYDKKSAEFLGLRLGRNKISLSAEKQAKFDELKQRLKGDNLIEEERRKLIKKLKSSESYKKHIKKINASCSKK